MTLAPTHVRLAPATYGRAASFLHRLKQSVVGEPSTRALIKDIRAGRIRAYTQPGVRRIWRDGDHIRISRASSGWSIETLD